MWLRVLAEGDDGLERLAALGLLLLAAAEQGDLAVVHAYQAEGHGEVGVGVLEYLAMCRPGDPAPLAVALPDFVLLPASCLGGSAAFRVPQAHASVTPTTRIWGM